MSHSGTVNLDWSGHPVGRRAEARSDSSNELLCRPFTPRAQADKISALRQIVISTKSFQSFEAFLKLALRRSQRPFVCREQTGFTGGNHGYQSPQQNP